MGFSFCTFLRSPTASNCISPLAFSQVSFLRGVSWARLTMVTDFMDWRLPGGSPSRAFLRMLLTLKPGSEARRSTSRCEVALKTISFLSRSEGSGSRRAMPVLASLGSPMFFSLQVKQGTCHSLRSSFHSELLTMWSIWSGVMSMPRTAENFLISFSCSRMVSSRSYFSSSCSFWMSFSSCRLATYLFLISLKRAFISSTSSFSDLQFFSMLSSQSSRRYFYARYSSSRFFCAFSFSFSFFMRSSSLLSSLPGGAWCEKCFCSESSFSCSARFSSCSLRSSFSLFFSSSSSYAEFSLFSLSRQTMRSWKRVCGSEGAGASTAGSAGSLPSSIILSFLISSMYSRRRASLGSSLILGLFWMNLALLAYRSVLKVSSQLQLAGETAAIMMVLVLPPSESCSRRVSLESRQGMWWVLPSTSAEMTLPRALRERLILVASFMPSPVTPVLLDRSEPARSTRLSLEALYFSLPFSSFSCESMQMVKMECEREDSAFMLVARTALLLKPSSMQCSILAMESTSIWRRSLTKTPLSGLSLRSMRALLSLPSRSWISSLQISMKLQRMRWFLLSFLVMVMIWLKVRGMIPRAYSLSLPPIIVCVFPHPVCPYAKIVPLYPSSTLSTSEKALCSQIRLCAQSAAKTQSKEKLFGCSFPSSRTRLIWLFFPSTSTTLTHPPLAHTYLGPATSGSSGEPAPSPAPPQTSKITIQTHPFKRRTTPKATNFLF